MAKRQKKNFKKSLQYKAVRYLLKEKLRQWKRKEIPDINNHIYVIWFLTRAPRFFNEERTVTSTNIIGKNGYTQKKRIKLDPYFIPYTKINSD